MKLKLKKKYFLFKYSNMRKSNSFEHKEIVFRGNSFTFWLIARTNQSTQKSINYFDQRKKEKQWK